MHMSNQLEISVNKYGGVVLGTANHYKNVLAYHENGGSGSSKTINVCSASGKTTELLRGITDLFELHELIPKDSYQKLIKRFLDQFKFNHIKLIGELFQDQKPRGRNAKDHFMLHYGNLKMIIDSMDFSDFSINQFNHSTKKAEILGFGELASSAIFSDYFNAFEIRNLLLDSREFIKTASPGVEDAYMFDYTNAPVDFEETKKICIPKFTFSFENYDMIVCQGFVAKDSRTGKDTLLGDDGSDYSGAVLGVTLRVKDVSYFKDVDAVMTEDPEKNPDARAIYDISYEDYDKLCQKNGGGPVRRDSVALLGSSSIPTYVRFVDRPFSKKYTTIH